MYSPCDISDFPPAAYLVYCVFETRSDSHPATPVGVDGLPVHVVEDNGLSAAVSRVPGRIREMRTDVPRVMAYEKVVETFHRDRAVLPMRYGCVMKDGAQVLELLHKHRGEYQSALTELEGCVEMGVRIIAQVEKRETRNESPFDVSTYSGGGAYLTARKGHYAEVDRSFQMEAAMAERCCAAFDGLFARRKTEYCPASNAVFLVPTLSLSFLVKRERENAFRRAFRTLSLGESERMLLSGPWPPYNFVPSDQPGEQVP